MMIKLKHLVAWVLGRRLVVLEHMDGDIRLRMERKDILGRPMAKWFAGTNIHNVVLLDDGKLLNGSYVMRWHLVADYRRKKGEVSL